jgi:hypothetical protein
VMVTCEKRQLLIGIFPVSSRLPRRLNPRPFRGEAALKEFPLRFFFSNSSESFGSWNQPAVASFLCSLRQAKPCCCSGLGSGGATPLLRLFGVRVAPTSASARRRPS